MLDAFRRGEDVYVATAAAMGDALGRDPFTRQEGKTSVLALNFLGGVGALRAMGAEGTDDQLWELVDAYRRASPNIIRYGRGLKDAWRYGGNLGRIRIEARGNDRYMWLPSGRALVYRNVRMNDEVWAAPGKRDTVPPTDGDDGEALITRAMRDGEVYYRGNDWRWEGPRKWRKRMISDTSRDPVSGGRKRVWGGTLSENERGASRRISWPPRWCAYTALSTAWSAMCTTKRWWRGRVISRRSAGL